MRFEIAYRYCSLFVNRSPDGYRDYSLKRSASRLLSGAQAPRLINPGAPGVSLNPSQRMSHYFIYRRPRPLRAQKAF